MNHPVDRLLIRIHILGMSSAFFSAVFGPLLKLYIIQCEGSAINKLAGCQPLRVQVHVSLSKRWQCPCHAISGFTCAVANASVILTNMIKHITWFPYVKLRFYCSKTVPTAAVRPAFGSAVPFIQTIHQKLLILVRGLPGSGKSFLAQLVLILLYY